jgi:hypothetical protein
MTVTFLSLRYRSVAKATVQDGGAGPAVVSERLNGDQATPEQIGPADACHRGATRTSPALFRECITLHAAGQHPAMTSSPWPIRTGLRSEELREGGCEARLAGLIRGLEVCSHAGLSGNASAGAIPIVRKYHLQRPDMSAAFPARSTLVTPLLGPLPRARMNSPRYPRRRPDIRTSARPSSKAAPFLRDVPPRSGWCRSTAPRCSW